MRAYKNLKWALLTFLIAICIFSTSYWRDVTTKMNVHSIVQAAEEYAAFHDIEVTLTWDSIYSNMDIYVKEPTGETASRWNPLTSIGGEIGYEKYNTSSEEWEWTHGDSGEGVGQETYRLENGKEGKYEITVYSPDINQDETTKASVFVIMNEKTYAEQYMSFSKSFDLETETWWTVGSFYYSPLQGSGGCFISTAAYGTPMAQEVRTLCMFRDRYLTVNCAGRTFIKLYETVSPPFSRVIARNKWLKSIVRIQLTPVVVLSKFILNL